MVHSELCTKILKGKEAVGVVESLLIFPVTAFDLAVVSGSVRTNKLVADAQLCSGLLK